MVNVQLIDARHDRHLWANRYDRPLADSLGLQGELAEEIADALRITLSPEEKARVEKRPTENAEAYVVYLQANQIERNPDTLLEDFKKAAQLYLQAITLDPAFRLAHARLASTQAQIYHFYEPLDSWKSKARAEAELAVRLQPNLAEAHLSLGQCDYWMEQDYDRALQEFATAARLSPNNADIGQLIAAIKRRQGHWQEALEAFERSHKIDPQNPNIVRNLVFTNTALRRWPEASRWAAQNASDGPGFTRRQDSKRLRRFLVEGRHALAQDSPQSGSGRNRSGWRGNVVPMGSGHDRPRFWCGAHGFAKVGG